MQAQRQEYPPYTTLKSSSDLGWSALVAELRSYPPSEGSGPAAPQAKIAIVLGGSEGIATYKIGGHWRVCADNAWPHLAEAEGRQARRGPYRLEGSSLGPILTQLSNDYNLPTVPDRSIRDEGGVQDEVINQIGRSVLSEMMSPTAAGRMLVETSSLLLAARLVHSHLDSGPLRLPIESRHRLDDRRLKRVLDYVEDHLSDDIAVADLANVACLSIFHFTRAFSSAIGVPPHRYISQRRLERAKAIIAAGDTSIVEAAFVCRFSSQSSFTRAFRRATGMTPAEYRRASAS
jgi:AraC family transcriptional regulator